MGHQRLNGYNETRSPCALRQSRRLRLYTTHASPWFGWHDHVENRRLYRIRTYRHIIIRSENSNSFLVVSLLALVEPKFAGAAEPGLSREQTPTRELGRLLNLKLQVHCLYQAINSPLKRLQTLGASSEQESHIGTRRWAVVCLYILLQVSCIP